MGKGGGGGEDGLVSEAFFVGAEPPAVVARVEVVGDGEDAPD